MKRFGYYIVAANGTWRRGIDLQDVQSPYMQRGAVKVEHNLYYLIANNCCDEELSNLLNCFYVSDEGSIMRCDGLEADDKQSIKDLLVGWSVERRKPK